MSVDLEAFETGSRAMCSSIWGLWTSVPLQCVDHIRAAKPGPWCRTQACFIFLGYCWQALPHSSEYWIKTSPCATRQPVFLIRTCTIFPCTICEDFLAGFPIHPPPRVWWLGYSIGCPTLIWCQLSANLWVQGLHSD